MQTARRAPAFISLAALAALLVGCLASPATTSPTFVAPTAAATSAGMVRTPSAVSTPTEALMDMSGLRLEPGTLVPFWSLYMLTASDGWGTAAWHIFRTEDGGHGWLDVTPPDRQLRDGDKYYRAYASFPAPLTAWVTLIDPLSPPEDIGVWTTRDGGTTWSRSSAGAPLPGVEVLSLLRAVDDSTAWLLVDAVIEPSADIHASRLYRTVDGGGSWAETSLPSAKPVDMEFLNGTTGFILEALSGEEQTDLMVWRTQDGGATWSATPIAPPADDPAFFERHGVCDRVGLSVTPDGWVAVTIECPQSDRAHYRSGDHGSSWASVPLPPPSDGANQVVWFSARDGLQLGRRMYRTEDGGGVWSHFKTVDWMGTFSFADPVSGWAIAESGPRVAFVHTDDAGASWEELDPRIVAAGPGRLSDLDTSSDTPAPLGVPVEFFDSFLITVQDVIIPADDYVSQATPGYPPPSAGLAYVAVTLSIACTTPGDGTCIFLKENDLFALRDEGEETYTALEGLAGHETLLPSSLAPGEEIEETMIFAAPADALGLVLLFSRFGWGEAYFALRQRNARVGRSWRYLRKSDRRRGHAAVDPAWPSSGRMSRLYRRPPTVGQEALRDNHNRRCEEQH